MSSIRYYSQLSEQYKEISSSRNSYLKSIDSLIVETIQEFDLTRVNYLDIGTGDGLRAIYIADLINAKSLKGIDNCANMLGEPNAKMEFIKADITEEIIYPQSEIITSLWNVFGHLGDEACRFKGFQNVNKSLTTDGLFFLDVNNRYNVRHYGFKAVIINFIQSIFKIKSRGYFTLEAGGEKTKVYIHTPFEIDRIATKTGFEIVKKLYVDYKTGEVLTNPFGGQIFYCLKKQKSM